MFGIPAGAEYTNIYCMHAECDFSSLQRDFNPRNFSEILVVGRVMQNKHHLLLLAGHASKFLSRCDTRSGKNNASQHPFAGRFL
jgi:hypothetical protein